MAISLDAATRRRGGAVGADTARDALTLAVFVLAAVSACAGGDDAVARGDRAWADADYPAALAEYRLALREGSRNPEIVARVAHAYAEVGRFEEARQAYERLLARSSEYVDQAVYDYVRLAQRALERGDRFGAAGAVEAALALRPGLPLAQLAPPLARYYRDTGDPERALGLYEQALAQLPADSAPALLFEMALLLEGDGKCGDAVAYYEAYRERLPRGAHAREARWHTGNCAFQLAQRAHEEGRLGDALGHVATVIGLGVPEDKLDEAWFERGEILFELGRKEEALEAYQRVLDLTTARGAQLGVKAERRIEQIRFGS
ncbi:MAG: tetratricopeptide repeat protein [Gemmatimonadetes bacterium]|nr:tetratricopeptide repeat protein [Gemmatimonadota bacterium]